MNRNDMKTKKKNKGLPILFINGQPFSYKFTPFILQDNQVFIGLVAKFRCSA